MHIPVWFFHVLFHLFDTDKDDADTVRASVHADFSPQRRRYVRVCIWCVCMCVYVYVCAFVPMYGVHVCMCVCVYKLILAFAFVPISSHPTCSGWTYSTWSPALVTKEDRGQYVLVNR